MLLELGEVPPDHHTSLQTFALEDFPIAPEVHHSEVGFRRLDGIAESLEESSVEKCCIAETRSFRDYKIL